jgi:DNA topoisomerase I
LSGAETPKPKKATGKAKDESNGSPKKGRAKKKEEEEEEEEVFKWWEVGDPTGDGSIKWQTLEHNGVIFPPPYESLPAGIQMKYNGMRIPRISGSVSYHFFPQANPLISLQQLRKLPGSMLLCWKQTTRRTPRSTRISSRTSRLSSSSIHLFVDMFLHLLMTHDVVEQRDGTKITSFEQCDFRPMFEYFEAEKARKKSLSAAEKKELKKTKDAYELKYTTCLLDGRKEKVGNFRVEPPGLFRGRGDHPKKGALKVYAVRRVLDPFKLTKLTSFACGRRTSRSTSVKMLPFLCLTYLAYGSISSTTRRSHGLQTGLKTLTGITNMSFWPLAAPSRDRVTCKSSRKLANSRLKFGS